MKKTHITVQVKDLLPNPFRHIERYPIKEDKITALRQSIRTTDFWDNIVGRRADGGVEIAYGHHRLVALQRELGSEHEVGINVREFSDADMIRIMANENMEEYGTSAWVEMETVHTVIDAYDRGLIELEEPDERTNERYIRSAARARGGYTAITVAKFLGWLEPTGQPQDKVTVAINALDLIERGILTEQHFAGLGIKQAEALVNETQRDLRRAETDVKVQHETAERQQKEADSAEQERKRALEAAQRARAEDERLAAERDAREAERREIIARTAAEHAKQSAEQREQEGRAQAISTGERVSRAMRTGKATYLQARGVAEEGRPTSQKPPRELDEHARRVSVAIGKILDSDDLVLDVKELVRYREQLSDVKLDMLAGAMRRAAERFVAAAEQFDNQRETPRQVGQPMLDAGSTREKVYA